MDRQSVFDYVACHLIEQGKPALRQVGGKTKCAYRGDDGTKCAIGCLIPDNRYDPSLEGFAVSWLVTDGILQAKREDLPFLEALQAAHDIGSAYVPGEWLDAVFRELDAVAGNFDLSTDVLEKVRAEHGKR